MPRLYDHAIDGGEGAGAIAYGAEEGLYVLFFTT